MVASVHLRAVKGLDRKLIAGLILGGIGLACVFIAPVSLFVLVLALHLAAAGELFRIARGRGTRPVPLVGLAGVAAAFAVAYHENGRAPEDLPAVAAAALLLAGAAVLLRRKREGAVVGVAVTAFVVVYVGLMGSYMIAMRGSPHGFRVVLVFGLMVVLNDAGGWALGRAAGRHPFAPRVSPEKTWEGLLGGTALTFAVGLAAGAGLDPPMTVERGLILAALVSITAPLGDLFESMLKRDFGVKDTGGVIPAHGGALDRLDSLIFSAPLFFYAFRALTS